jgi:hypothetical protein
MPRDIQPSRWRFVPVPAILVQSVQHTTDLDTVKSQISNTTITTNVMALVGLALLAIISESKKLKKTPFITSLYNRGITCPVASDTDGPPSAPVVCLCVSVTSSWTTTTTTTTSYFFFQGGLSTTGGRGWTILSSAASSHPSSTHLICPTLLRCQITVPILWPVVNFFQKVVFDAQSEEGKSWADGGDMAELTNHAAPR